MANVAVIGAQWGDEGKGKIVDWLSSRADVVVRFQGGHNAGHTLVIDGIEYKLSLLPSGIVRPGKLSVIGNGVVIDPAHLLEEISILRSQGAAISPASLLVSESAALILPVHQAVDAAREALRGAGKIGTTGRGIGPAYEDKIARRAVRFGDLASENVLTEKLVALVAHHNVWLAAAGQPLADADKMKADLLAMRDELLTYTGQSWRCLADARAANKVKAPPMKIAKIIRINTPRSGSFAKACTDVKTPERTINVPIRENPNARMAKRMVQLFKLSRFSTTIAECNKAAARSHGIKEAFSTGSQNQKPPQPNS